MNDGSSIGASLGGMPSLVNSMQSLTNSKISLHRPKSPEAEEVIAELLEKAKFYTSLCLGIHCSRHTIIKNNIFFPLGTTAILSVFAFLFLIPFVVDPAISTIVADYDQAPVTCIVTDHTYGEGLRNCTWSSCREGCTTAATKWANKKKTIRLPTNKQIHFQMPSTVGELHKNLMGRMAKSATWTGRNRMGRGRHKVANKLGGLWLSATGKLHRICQGIWVKKKYILNYWNLLIPIFGTQLYACRRTVSMFLQ